MISIKITKKFNALVDLDHAYLKNYHWIVRRIGNTNYAFRKAYGKYFAWNMSWDVIGLPEKGLVVDHIDGDGLNNMRSNLRFLTHRQNCQNRHSKMTSMYPGVKKVGDKFLANIRINGVQTYLGSYDVELDAANAYKAVNDSLGLPEVIQPFTEEPKVDPNVISRDEYFRMFQLMKQDGLSDEEIEGNLKGVRIAEDEKATINRARSQAGNRGDSLGQEVLSHEPELRSQLLPSRAVNVWA